MSDDSILIVDDNQLNLKMISFLLTAKGFRVIIATDAKEALQALGKSIPSLILMDVQLPGMDGLELTRQLKANPKYQSIPIIAITAYAMKGDKEKALSAGCDAYIAKPIDTRTLPDLIAEFIKKSR